MKDNKKKREHVIVKQFSLIFSMICVVSFVGACAKSQSERSLLRKLDILPMSDKAPELVLPALNGYEDISIANYRGNLVMLHVWVSWCKYCQQEAPYIAKLIEAAQDIPNIKIIGLTTDRDRDAALQYVKKYGLTNPIMHDEEGKKINGTGVFRIRGTPTSFYISPSGRMLGKVEGYKKFDPEKKLEQLIELAHIAK